MCEERVYAFTSLVGKNCFRELYVYICVDGKSARGTIAREVTANEKERDEGRERKRYTCRVLWELL